MREGYRVDTNVDPYGSLFVCARYVSLFIQLKSYCSCNSIRGLFFRGNAVRSVLIGKAQPHDTASVCTWLNVSPWCSRRLWRPHDVFYVGSMTVADFDVEPRPDTDK